MDYASKLPRGGLRGRTPKKVSLEARVIPESLSWASVTLVSVLPPEKALLVSLTLKWPLLVVNQRLWLQQLLPSLSCCGGHGKTHWEKRLSVLWLASTGCSSQGSRSW